MAPFWSQRSKGEKEMYKVDIYAKIRRDCLVEKESERSVACKYGINRRTVSKILKNAHPPGYRRKSPPVKPKLVDYEEFIDEILLQDKKVHRKQRHTARKSFERLRKEKNYDGDSATVQRYVKLHREKHKEVFCPLAHPAGDAQVDFGEARAIIGGEQCKIHFFVMDLPYSDGLFVKAYPRENTESFLDGHVSAFEYFEGVPNRIVYDNSKIAVARIVGNEKRETTQAFQSLQSHYLFKEAFARVGKGNDKGKVENLIGYSRRNFMVPIPEFANFDELNEHLLVCTIKRQERTLRGHKKTIAERLVEDKAAYLSLPASRYEACNVQVARVSSQALVRYKCNDYSVPVVYGYREVLVKGFVGEVVIAYGAEVIARHPRCYEREETVFNPVHYLSLLERKTRAFDQAAPLKDWNLPACFERLRNCLEGSQGKEGKREYIRILRLFETFTLKEVEFGVEQGLQRGIHTHEAIRHLILHHKEPTPEFIDMSGRSELAAVNVQTTYAMKYSELISGRAA